MCNFNHITCNDAQSNKAEVVSSATNRYNCKILAKNILEEFKSVKDADGAGYWTEDPWDQATIPDWRIQNGLLAQWFLLQAWREQIVDQVETVDGWALILPSSYIHCLAYKTVSFIVTQWLSRYLILEHICVKTLNCVNNDKWAVVEWWSAYKPSTPTITEYLLKQKMFSMRKLTFLFLSHGKL